MGASNSKLQEDKAQQLCHERKKYVRQALDGRCSLAATHIAYIQELKLTGTALRRFVEPEGPIESSIYTSTSATPEPLALTEKTSSQFSFASPSLSQHVDAADNISPSPSPPSSTHYQAHRMQFRGTFSRPVTVSVSSSTPQTTTLHSDDAPGVTPSEASSVPPETSPWDYFGLFHPVDPHTSSHEAMGYSNQGFEFDNHISHPREEERIHELDDDEDKSSSVGREESLESENEFDEPATPTLVRSFENVNRTMEHVAPNDLASTPSPKSVASDTKFSTGEKSISPNLSPLRGTSLEANNIRANGAANRLVLHSTPLREKDNESKVSPKDFFSSMKDIEALFVKASDSGREVPRMLEANKFHFRPISHGKESGPMTSSFLKACFSCGEDPSQVQEEPPQASAKYLTWHRTASSRSSSSRNPLGVNTMDDVDSLTSSLFDNSCMVSGSHASTLDRLFAWEKKLYDEVKASEKVREEYDRKCKELRQLESKAESRNKIDKTRAVVKDLHSRIRVAIHRIDSISKKIEELRDTELQPQLEELIEGLRRMWEVMSDCHKLQFHIISISYAPGNTKISIQSDTRRQITIHLENELISLSSSFRKWIDAQKTYVGAINNWLFKCVSLPQKSSRKKRRPQAPALRDLGPPIYVTCGVWLDMFEKLPTKEVADSMKDLASEIAHFIPRQEKNQGKGVNDPHSELWKGSIDSDAGVNLLRDGASEDWAVGLDRFRTSLAGFLGGLSNYAESSVRMYADLQKAIQDRKISYAEVRSQS